MADHREEFSPFAAFIVELRYGILCWRVYRGTRALLALIVLANLANLSFFSASIPGPEQYLAGRPLLRGHAGQRTIVPVSDSRRGSEQQGCRWHALHRATCTPPML
jgi:hypothetical protein